MTCTYPDGQPVKGYDRVEVVAWGPGGARKKDLGRTGWVVSPMDTRVSVSLRPAPGELRPILATHLRLVERATEAWR